MSCAAIHPEAVIPTGESERVFLGYLPSYFEWFLEGMWFRKIQVDID